MYVRSQKGETAAQFDMDFDEVLMRVSAKMVDILGIYVCLFEKKVVPLHRNSND